MISGSTRLAAVIGDPVRHSLSPAIHNAAFAACRLDWVYVALPVAAGDGAKAVEAMRTFGIDGLSVTMPHKADVVAEVDGLTDSAQSLGVANCLFWRNGRLMADSTDGDGFVAAYESQFQDTMAGKNVLVAGAGGAARAIVEAAGRAGVARLVIGNRTPHRAEAAAELAPQAVPGPLDDADLVASMDVVINATAVGMAGGPDPTGMPVPEVGLHSGQQVLDIVYQPGVTPLLAAAGRRGATTANGLAMLVHQAALAFEHWTGQPAPLEAMAAAVDSTL